MLLFPIFLTARLDLEAVRPTSPWRPRGQALLSWRWYFRRQSCTIFSCYFFHQFGSADAWRKLCSFEKKYRNVLSQLVCRLARDKPVYIVSCFSMSLDNACAIFSISAVRRRIGIVFIIIKNRNVLSQTGYNTVQFPGKHKIFFEFWFDDGSVSHTVDQQ